MRVNERKGCNGRKKASEDEIIEKDVKYQDQIDEYLKSYFRKFLLTV